MTGWLLLGCAAARAVDVDPFDPAGAMFHGGGAPLVEAPQLGAPGLQAGLVAAFVENVLSATQDDPALPGSSLLPLVGHAGYTVGERFRADVFVPFYAHVDAPASDVSGAALGDLRAQAVLVAWRPGAFALAVRPGVGLGTGSAALNVRRGWSASLAADGGVDGRRLGWTGSLGLDAAAYESWLGTGTGTRAELGAAGWFHATEALRAGAELAAHAGLVAAADSAAVVGVFAEGATADGVRLGVSADTGLLRGIGAPDYRLAAVLAYAPAGDRDADRDGLRDPIDACVDAAEDPDGFDDADGCPERDNDGDGAPDLSDGCPNAAEDRDGHEDQDGCPDGDDDLDGVADAEDRCPTIAGDVAGCPDVDHDGLLDTEDHCPQMPGPAALGGCPDRDGDTVPDPDDRCPDDPGPPVDGHGDGCAEVQWTAPGVFRTRQRVNFATGTATLAPDGKTTLDEVVSLLSRHPEIARLEVGGHTDNVGNPAANLSLSQKRADAVVAYLISRGVAPERLVAKGYGQERPMDSNRTEDGRQNNRRVEFTVLDSEKRPPDGGAR